MSNDSSSHLLHPVRKRICPACAEHSTICPSENLWPSNWKCKACGFELPMHGPFVSLAPDLDAVDEGMPLEGFDLLASAEDGHFWFVSRNELIGWLVGQFATDAKHVLELGCGTGFVISALRQALPEATITGSELHSRGLETAHKRHGSSVELIQMDARHSGLSNALDLVGAFDVLEHIPEDEAVLAGIAKMLRPGGKLIATVPQHPWMWSSADDVAHHVRRYKRGELSQKVERAGLRTVYTSSFVTLAFPLMIASRLLERVRRPGGRSLEDVMADEFKISPAMNTMLFAICQIEHRLRKVGVPLPFGGSQVLVAERVRVTP